MQSQILRKTKFHTKRFSKQNSYKWEIIWNTKDNVIQSPNFYPLGSENKWFLSFKMQCVVDPLSQMQTGHLSVQFRSQKKTDRFVTLEFFVNEERLSDPLSGCVCGSYSIGTIRKSNAFYLRACVLSYGTLRVTWTWENMECGATNLHQVLQSNFHSMLESGKFSDLTIETKDGSKIPVHRAILSARCPVFRAMLENDMLEAKTQCINISDFSPATVENMVNYLYTGEMPEYSFDSATDLLRIADIYDLTPLKSACAETLIGYLSKNNAVQHLLLADIHPARSLKEKALKFISENQSHFAIRNKLHILKHRPELLLDVTLSISKN